MKITFSFGKNWLRYVKYILDETIIQNASNSLQNFLPQIDFKDYVFLDIGCGSGLFSLCAQRLGAKRVISFDLDANSIKASKLCQERFAPNSTNWQIKQGNILDDELVSNLSQELKNDKVIVYSWGVLHHTGDVFKAMANTAKIAKKEGSLVYISIYNQTEASDFWLKIKRYYNQTNPIMKFLLVLADTAFLTFEDIRKGRGLNMYDKSRGMYKITDVTDWLGGLPYEPLKADELIAFWQKQGFESIKFAPTRYHEPIYPKSFFYKYFVYFKQVGLGCNEYLFRSIPCAD